MASIVLSRNFPDVNQLADNCCTEVVVSEPISKNTALVVTIFAFKNVKIWPFGNDCTVRKKAFRRLPATFRRSEENLPDRKKCSGRFVSH
jgi:hypothetical protein